MIEDRKPKFFYGYVVVIAAFIIMMVMGGTLYSFGVFFKPLLTEFGWTRAMTSGAFSLSMLMYGALAIVTGRLSDRFGPRIVATVCGFLLGLGYLLMSQIGAIWHFYLFYGVIIGIGLSGYYVPLVSTAARWFTQRRGMMTGIVVSGLGIGTVIMPPIASWLISTYGWRTSYIIMGIIALVFTILAAQFLRRDPGQMRLLPYGEKGVEEDSLGLEAGGFSFRQAIHTRQFWLLCAINICFGFFLQVIMVHIVPHATDLEISAASAASVLAIIGGTSTAGRITMGSISDRIGNKSAFIICCIMLSIALFWLLAAKELWMFCLFAGIFGFGYGGSLPVVSLIMAELFGLSSLGAILGSTDFILTIGAAVGPVLAGRIFDITGSYQPAFLVCAIISVTGVILASLLRPTGSRGGEIESKRST